MGYDLDSGAHSVYSLHYYLILTTKYRRGMLTEEATQFIHGVISGFTENYGVELTNLDGEDDHVHILFRAKPTTDLVTFINTVKGATARRLRNEYEDEVNLLAINIAGLGVFWHLGYRPPTWLGVEHTRKTVLKRSAALVLAILVVSVPLLVTTHSKIQGTQLEDRAEADARTVLEQPQYADVTVRSVRVVKDPSDVTHPPERVVVVLGVPPGTHYPDLSPLIAETITEHSDRDLDVRVKYVHVAERVAE